MRRNFLGKRHSLLSQFVISFTRSASLYCEECVCVCVCVCTHLTACELCMNYRCYQLTARMQHFYTKRKRCEVFTLYLSLGLPAWQWLREYDIGQNVVESYFQTGSSSSPRYCHIFFLFAFLEEATIKNIVVILGFNFIIILNYYTNHCTCTKFIKSFTH